jgi:GT2 family glycosyltransferase
MNPLVDIVILNHNTAGHTIECLESVMRMDYPSFRVILCDNRSTDDSLERLRAWLSGRSAFDPSPVPERFQELVSPPVAKPIPFVEAQVGSPMDIGDASVVILRLDRNAGFAGGNNPALDLSLRDGRAAFAWILNNDVVVARDALTRLVEVAETDARIAAVGATLLEYHAPDTVQAASGGTVSCWTGRVTSSHQLGVAHEALDRSSTEYNFVSCCSLLARREALAAIGLLDERFFIYAEDGDFSLRMSHAGWRLAYAPDALVWHKGSATTVRGSPFNDYHQVRSSLLFVHKWARGRMPVAFAYWCYRGLGPKLMRRQWSRVAAVCRAFADVFREIRAA